MPKHMLNSCLRIYRCCSDEVVSRENVCQTREGNEVGAGKILSLRFAVAAFFPRLSQSNFNNTQTQSSATQVF